MQNRPIKGSTAWTKYTITLNVPMNATDIAYGVLLNGAGAVYFDDMSIDVVGPADAANSGVSDESKLPDAPENLNFESH